MFRRFFGLFAVLAMLAIGAGPSLAQSPKDPKPGSDKRGLTNPDDPTSRKDTVVLHPKDGETISVKLPKQGQLFIVSQIPWAVTGGKIKATDLIINYEVRGIEVQHIGTNNAKASFTLRLLDGRTITVNVRTTKAKFNVGYAVIT
jgi:hypothetical protein